MNEKEFLNAINKTVITDIDNEYLFKKELEEIKKGINKVADLFAELENNNKHNKNKINNDPTNNVFSIVGERGTGKSSLMERLRNELKKDGHFVFEIIDPSIFDDSLSVSELFLSRVYMEIKKQDHEGGPDATIIKIYNQLKQMIKTLANIKIDRGTFAQKNPDTELLEDITKRTEFRNTLTELIRDFKKLVLKETQIRDKKQLILFIDDIDMTLNHVVYEMLEDIRKFMPQEMIIVISYREHQLFDSAFAYYIKQNQLLIDLKCITVEEIKGQTARYLEKVVPLSNRISLPSHNKVWNLKISALFFSIGFSKSEIEDIKNQYKPYVDANDRSEHRAVDKSLEEYDPTVIDWIEDAIYSKIKILIRPIDPREFTGRRIPTNLRGINQLIYIVHFKMFPIKFYKNDLMQNKHEYNEMAKTLIKNMNLYTDYLQSYSMESLTNEHQNIISKWISASVKHKNYLIYSNIVSAVEKDSALVNRDYIYNQLLSIKEIQPHNIAISDVHTLFELYKSCYCEDEEAMHFVFLMKILYSVEILSKYLMGAIQFWDSVENERSDCFEEYLVLLNAYIVSENILIVSKITPEIRYQNHENLNQEDKIKYIEFINNFVYTERSSRGDVSKSLRQNGRVVNTLSRSSYRYQYYNYFNYNDKMVDVVDKNLIYKWNPFSMLAKKYYIERNINSNGCSNDLYIFYSLFDLDILSRNL